MVPLSWSCEAGRELYERVMRMPSLRLGARGGIFRWQGARPGYHMA